jgi:hypothetical protein
MLRQKSVGESSKLLPEGNQRMNALHILSFTLKAGPPCQNVAISLRDTM